MHSLILTTIYFWTDEIMASYCFQNYILKYENRRTLSFKIKDNFGIQALSRLKQDCGTCIILIMQIHSDECENGTFLGLFWFCFVITSNVARATQLPSMCLPLGMANKPGAKCFQNKGNPRKISERHHTSVTWEKRRCHTTRCTFKFCSGQSWPMTGDFGKHCWMVPLCLKQRQCLGADPVEM